MNQPAPPSNQLDTSTSAPGIPWLNLASVLGILAGLGGASLLEEDSPRRWVLGLGGGVLVLGAALVYLLWPLMKTGIPGLLQRSRAALSILVARLPAVKLQKRVPWLSITRRAAESESSAGPAPASASQQSHTPLSWEIWQALLVGAILLLPALSVRLAGAHGSGRANLLAIYFSTPAIILWAGSQAVDLYPHWVVRPRHLPQISGLLGGGMQLLGALLLWVHLGMDSSIEVSTWMFWLAAALAGAGIVFKLFSQAAQAIPSSGM